MSTFHRVVARHARQPLALAIIAAFAAMPAVAQQMDHSKMDHSKMHHPPATTEPAEPKPTPKKKKPAAPAAKPADPHAGHTMPMPANPHAGHSMPAAQTHSAEPADHSTMDHSAMDHSAMDHFSPAAPELPRTPIPVLTAEDRAAAFPELAGHAAHDRSPHSYWLIDRLEASADHDDSALEWKATGWIGGDINRLWLRSEGTSTDGRVRHGDLEVLGGHAISPWWNLLAGLRQDFGEGQSQTFAAVGVTGLAPYKVEVEATAYLGSSGQSAARFEAGYDTLLTNRLILQWHAEANLYGKDDEARGIGAGLATLDAGVRLRYEITRQFAPYIGLTWERAFAGTADFRRDHLEDVSDTRLVAGVRVWF